MKVTSRFLLFALALVVMTTACKFFFGADLDMSGFSPVIAIALFAGLIMKQRSYSFLLPLAALLISDLIIHGLYLANKFDYAGIYHGQWKVYLILLSATVIGMLLKGKSYVSLFVGALAAPTLFFLTSNFFVWKGAEGMMYSQDFSGLINCYVAAIPFYRNALLGTLVFLPAILVVYNMAMHKKAELLLAR